MVVRLDPRVALGVVAHVHEDLIGAPGQHDLFQQGAGARALLVDRDASARSHVGVTDRIGASLGDSGEESLGAERALDVA